MRYGFLHFPDGLSKAVTLSYDDSPCSVKSGETLKISE